VESVTWDMVQEFIRKLNAMDPDADYRLPTEAEWEYAARAGSRTALANGNLEGLYCEKYPNLDRLSWYCGNSDGKVHPAAEKQPNRWGLYDMHGNVQEWCQDWYAEYPKGPVTDPEGPDSGSYRIMRGGNWYDNAYLCRSAYRYYHRTSYYDSILGFRLVREAR
jgi:formylglycine-generating enzyme required for sulfatase activity